MIVDTGFFMSNNFHTFYAEKILHFQVSKMVFYVSPLT